MFEDVIKENAELGAKLVNKYLKGEIQGSDKVVIGSKAITQFNRHMATKGNFDAIKFAVGRSISKDQDELKKYISENLSDYSQKRIK